MELKKKYWIKTFSPSHLAYKGPHQLAATCNISSHPFSSDCPHWRVSSSGGWKRSVLFFPWNIFSPAPCLCVWVASGSPGGMCTLGRFGSFLCSQAAPQKNSNKWNMEGFQYFQMAESLAVYTVVTVLYFNYFSAISMHSLAFLVNIWFPNEGSKGRACYKEILPVGPKILPMNIFLLKIQYVFLALSGDYEANENGSCCIHLPWVLLPLEIKGHWELCITTLGRIWGGFTPSSPVQGHVVARGTTGKRKSLFSFL